MGKILAPFRKYKIDRLGNIIIPTLISSAGNSQNYIFSETDDIYFEAEIYLNSYDVINIIIESSSTTYYIENEFAFAISDVTEVGDRSIPQGAFFVYNGERGASLSCYYTNSVIVNLNTWTKVSAERKNNNWKLFINNIECSVSRVTDAGIPDDRFGNENLTVYIGKSEAGGQNFDGQIRNVILGNKLVNNKISIKKQNLTKLKPYSINGGVTVYDDTAVYVFKGGSTNTISTVFNFLELVGSNSSSSADLITIATNGVGKTYWYKNSGLGGTGWREVTAGNTTNQANTVINTNDLIYFTPRSLKEISVGSGAIIQRYYDGKLNLN